MPDGSVKPSARTPYRDLAVDVGRSCDAVLEFAFRAAQLRRTPLRVVHVWHVPFGRGIPDAEERGLIRENAERELAALLAPWRDRFPGVFVRDTLYEGRPAQVLVKANGRIGPAGGGPPQAPSRRRFPHRPGGPRTDPPRDLPHRRDPARLTRQTVWCVTAALGAPAAGCRRGLALRAEWP
ncbi:universal stress protein [Streptomyces sp. 2A115]|uniref:universal stress protein n=1 Tax=Streptomyces sp. 2A115 TaxID=3457439 RepID=UPI003FD39406